MIGKMGDWEGAKHGVVKREICCGRDDGEGAKE